MFNFEVTLNNDQNWTIRNAVECYMYCLDGNDLIRYDCETAVAKLKDVEDFDEHTDKFCEGEVFVIINACMLHAYFLIDGHKELWAADDPNQYAVENGYDDTDGVEQPFELMEAMCTWQIETLISILNEFDEDCSELEKWTDDPFHCSDENTQDAA